MALYVGPGADGGFLGNGASTAAAGLCQPLVRSKGGHGDCPDLVRPVRRRCRLAVGVPGGISGFGWQATMLAYAVVVLVVMLPLILMFGRYRSRRRPAADRHGGAGAAQGAVAGLHPNVVQALLCLAGSAAASHVVPRPSRAFCSDLGINPRVGPSCCVMLGLAFLARQAWARWPTGRRIAYDPAGSASCRHHRLLPADPGRRPACRRRRRVRLCFAGIIRPIRGIRDLFRPSEASWRMPLTLFTAMSGMAVGSWLAGFL